MEEKESLLFSNVASVCDYFDPLLMHKPEKPGGQICFFQAKYLPQTTHMAIWVLYVDPPTKKINFLLVKGKYKGNPKS